MPDLAFVQDGQPVDPNPDSRIPRDRIRQAREHRRQFEPIWQMSAAYAAGQHWLVADRFTRTLRNIQQVDPAYADRELYSFDIIGEYRSTALGELGSDDDRPELLLERDDEASEDFQTQVNRAVGYGWDYEWRGDDALAESDRLCVDLGTSAIQCSFDPSSGPIRADQVPHYQGAPVFGDQARQLLAGGPNPAVQMKAIREGRITWRPLSAFNILVPPGVTHEKYFPWEATVIPTPLEEVKERYGQPAAELREDADIGSILGMGAPTTTTDPSQWMIGESRRTRLRDHVWLFTYYERPTQKFPNGRTLVFAGNQMKLVHSEDKLPYQGPDGTYRSGISYFHWWRVTGRFWSRSLIDALKDIQRANNKRETQKNEIIDRGMPFVLVDEKQDGVINRKGTPVEVIAVKNSAGAPPPVVHPGIGPGDWFYKSTEELREAMQHASGIRAPSLGENPSNVNTYSQLALIHEADHTKREPIRRERELAIGRLVEDSVYDIRTYWGPEKQIRLAGDEDRVKAEVFDATRVPTFFIVKRAKGSAKPRSQAAELKKVEQIYQASIDSGQPLPVQWLYDSLEAGEPLELPEQPGNDQADKAELENHLLLAGDPVVPDYFDPPEVHIPVHRSAQIQARLTGDQAAWQRIEDHVNAHELAAEENAAKLRAIQARNGGPPSDQQQPSAPAGPPAPAPGP